MLMEKKNKMPPRATGTPSPRGLFHCVPFVVALFLAGCVNPPGTAELDRVHATAEQMRRHVNEVRDNITALAPVVDMACGHQPRPPQCDEVDRAWSVAQRAIQLANDAITAYDATGIAVDQVSAAVSAVRAAADLVRDAVAHLVQP